MDLTHLYAMHIPNDFSNLGYGLLIFACLALLGGSTWLIIFILRFVIVLAGFLIFAPLFFVVGTAAGILYLAGWGVLSLLRSLIFGKAPLSSNATEGERVMEEPSETESEEEREPGREEGPWNVLGIKKGASLEEARNAFRSLVKLYHPDQLALLPTEDRQFAENRMKAINLAYEELESSNKSRL